MATFALVSYDDRQTRSRCSGDNSIAYEAKVAGMYGQSRDQRDGARSLQFSLRSMFVLTAFTAICFAAQRSLGAEYLFIVAVVVATYRALRWLFYVDRWTVSPSLAAPKRANHGMMWSFVIIAILVALFTHEPRRYGPSRRGVCSNNLKQIGLGILQYEVAFGTLPSAFIPDWQGKPKHSWRLLILPFFDPSIARAYRFNESWNGPNNVKLAATKAEVFSCPSSPTQMACRTDYVAVTGPGTAWPDATGARLQDIGDPSQCILLIELPDSDIHWMEPRDITLKEAIAKFSKPNAKLSGHNGGANVLFADHRIHFLDQNSLVQQLQAMLPTEGDDAK